MVLAHEVAHLWFGCLVEGRWWDDLWLAEALATYLGYTARQEALGPGSPWRAFCMREQAAACQTDSLPGTQPVSSPVNDAAEALARPFDIAYSQIRFDERSLRALLACAMDVDDPLTEAVCWTAAWDMTTAAELSVAEFTDLMVRRISGGRPRAGVAELLEHVRDLADYYAVPVRRPGLRQRMAAAALDGARTALPGSRVQRALAAGFAASAHSESQLGLLRCWLSGTSLSDGVPADLELRGQILATLSARGLAGDDDLDALAAADPVGGEAQRSTCRALRPDSAAKEATWTAALDGGQSPRMAQAHARGIWAPGQERILAPYRDRYTTEALPALSRREVSVARKLARLLYPAILADSAAVTATDAALERDDLGGTLRLELLEQRAIVQQVLAARASSGGRLAAGNPPADSG